MSKTVFLPVDHLTPEAYAPYGQVIMAHESTNQSQYANQGTAIKFNHIARVVNNRPQTAKPNLCVFRCSPVQPNQSFAPHEFEIKLLERHEFSTQFFVPMMNTSPTRYLVIVAHGDDYPDLNTMKVFIANGNQGISYNEGTWHHPMIALDKVIDFCVMVHEDGTKKDCEIVLLSEITEKQFKCMIPPARNVSSKL